MIAPPSGSEAGPVSTVVFSDLDGTLLDLETYSCEEARPAVELLRSRGIPLVVCSSKTRAEIEHHRRELGLDAPFIVENGSAIFIPAREGCSVIELGLPVAEVRSRLAGLGGELGRTLRGYADLPLSEIRRLTGLDEGAAQRASLREYSETLLQESFTPEALDRLQEALAACGLSGAAGSRFVTVTGRGADKGQATRLLLERYRQENPCLISVALGDGSNDGPMLAAVDLPYLVRKPAGSWAETGVARLAQVEGVGPAGFHEVIVDLFGPAGSLRSCSQWEEA